MEVIDLGRKSYPEVWELQKQLLLKRIDDEITDTLILVEHDPVYTIGRSLTGSGIQKITVPELGEVPVLEVERGGKWTFHGPGQLVGYPIFKIQHQNIRRYLREMEGALSAAVKEVSGLEACGCPKTKQLEPGQLQTGLWVGDKKIASIGIAIKRWVSYHGFALNVSTDLRYFHAISPCGFTGEVMTSVLQEGSSVDIQKLKASLVKKFDSNFSQTLNRI